jgi:hypothetical protein
MFWTRAHRTPAPAQLIEVEAFFGAHMLALERVPLGRALGLAELTFGSGPAPHAYSSELLRRHGDDSVLVWPEGARVRFVPDEPAAPGAPPIHAGELCPQPDGARATHIPEGGSVCVELDALSLRVRRVPAEPGPARAPLDLAPHRYTALSAAVHGVLLATLLFAPPSGRGLCMDNLNDDSLRRVQTTLLAIERERQALFPAHGEAGGSEGQRAKDHEGASGDPAAPKTPKRGQPRAGGASTAAQDPRAQAATAGVLGVIPSASVVGSGAFSTVLTGYDASQAMGALFGAELGASFGAGGLGMRNAGRGGGGDGEGTIGVGRLGTLGGSRGGDGHGPGYGHGAGGLRTREARVPTVHGSPVEVRGGLSKETIRRVIQRHLNEVRFCYEQGLRSQPDLHGRVSVKFVIAPSGAVQAASVADSSVGARSVETCIEASVRRFAFPAPDGGGVVIVTYPFVLESAG